MMRISGKYKKGDVVRYRDHQGQMRSGEVISIEPRFAIYTVRDDGGRGYITLRESEIKPCQAK